MVLKEIGPEKFVAIITDNASNMRSAWRKIQTLYPHIDCIGCTAHGLNLLFNDITKIDHLKSFYEDCKKIVKHITKRHACLATFEEKQKEKYGSQYLTLKLPSKTRSAGSILTFKSLLANRDSLSALVIDQDIRIDPNIKQMILSDSLSSKLKVMEKMLSPITEAIYNLESDKGLISEVPAAFMKIKKQIAGIVFSDDCTEITNSKDVILNYIEKHRLFCIQPFHLAAYLLDPRFHNSVYSYYEPLTDNEFLQVSQYIVKLADILQKSTPEIMANFAEYQARSGFGLMT